MTSVTIRSNVAPDVTFDPTAKASGAQGINLLRLIKPSVDVKLPFGDPIHYAPYGEPTGSGLAVGALVLAFAVYGLFKFVKG